MWMEEKAPPGLKSNASGFTPNSDGAAPEFTIEISTDP
jgi:hypothetical protein